jgi:hypothetical protein
VAADWDSGGSDTGTDTIKISETRTASSADAYDIDPDAENYAAGNDPDIAYRNQGRADSPNGWASHPGADGYQENDGHLQGDYGEGIGDHDEPQEDGYDDGPPDLWGDTDPDAANYADLDRIGTGSPDRQQSPREDRSETDHDADTDARQPGQDQPAHADADQAPPPERRTSEPEADQLDRAEPAAADTGERLSPEQQRINALEAENADTKQRMADLEEKNADASQQIADLKAVKDEQAIRLDRIEQLLASADLRAGDAGAADRGADESDATRHQDASLDERAGTRQGNDAKRDEQTRWRRAVSSDNVGIAGTLVGAADTVAQFAMHATPEGMVGLGAMALGLASVGLAKAEKRRKENHDRPDQYQGGEGTAGGDRQRTALQGGSDSSVSRRA